MKATKYSVTITVDVLSLDSIPALFEDTLKELQQEVHEGKKRHEDGDQVSWNMYKEEIEF